MVGPGQPPSRRTTLVATVAVTSPCTVKATSRGTVIVGRRLSSWRAVVEGLAEEYMAWILRAIPMGRLAESEELGWVVRFLASEEAGYITGQTLVLDGGQLLAEGAG